MALKDIPQYDPNAFVDPKTGLPYPYGSPGYQAAILPYLNQQLQSNARESSNARGSFYSGPAMADEQQAASNLLYQMSQQGAQQSATEAQLLQQQKFQAQQQASQNEAASSLAAQQGAANLKAGAVSGGLNAVGTLGGLYAAKNLFPGMAGNAAVAGGTNDLALYNSLMKEGAYDPQAAANAAQYMSGGSNVVGAGSIEPTPWYESATGAESGLGSAGTVAGAGLAALTAYNLGGGPKAGLAPELGGGIGGALGAYGGSYLGPWGAMGGAAAGSWAGRNLGNFFNHLF